MSAGNFSIIKGCRIEVIFDKNNLSGENAGSRWRLTKRCNLRFWNFYEVVKNVLTYTIAYGKRTPVLIRVFTFQKNKALDNPSKVPESVKGIFLYCSL